MSDLYQLHQPYYPAGDQQKAISALLAGLSHNLRYQTLLGVTGSGKTYTVANVIAQSQRPALLLAPNKTLAGQLYAEMKEFFPQHAVEYFVSYYDYYQPEAYIPASDLYIEKDSSINAHLEQLRLAATKSLLERRDVIIVATVSVIYGIGNPREYHSMVLVLRVGKPCPLYQAVKQLVTMQYRRDDVEFTRGTFRLRGDCLDVFPAEQSEYAIRVHLEDHVVTHISEFDALTGQVIRTLQRFHLYPASHYVTQRDTVLRAVTIIQEELREVIDSFEKKGQFVEAQRIAQRTRFDLEILQETGFCKGVENYSRHFLGSQAGQPPPTLLDYLPADTLIVVDESHVTIPQLRAMYQGDRSRKENLISFGFRLPSARDNRPLTFEEFEKYPHNIIFVSATPAEYEASVQQNVVEQIIRPTGLLDPLIDVRPATHQVSDLREEVLLRMQRQERVLATVLTKKMAEKLAEYLSECDVPACYMHSDMDVVQRAAVIRDLRLGIFGVLIGINLLREGLDIPEVSLVAILDADKEGFLRSERSLIQTIGRAARHVNGTVIFYANHKTESMKKAIEETNRRREKQAQYNQEQGILPRGVHKKVRDWVTAAEASGNVVTNLAYRHQGKEVVGVLKKLEKKMREYAKQLDFEKAKAIRDEMRRIKADWFQLG